MGQRFRLPAGGVAVGRIRGAILFPDDPYVSGHHASLLVRDGRLYVRDETSASGVFVSVNGQEAVAPHTYFATGSRLFHFAGSIEPRSPAPGHPLPYGAPLQSHQPLYCVEEVLVGNRAGRAMVSAGQSLTIGQANCDLSYPSDADMAPRHCELALQPNGATLRDLSGALGTFVRLSPGTERLLKAGDRLRIGQQLLQVEAIA